MQIIMVGQLSAVKGAGELGGVKRLWRWWWWWRLDQYTSQFLMRERIGPSQADGNPASLSAWGGLSSLPVSRLSGSPCFLLCGTTAPLVGRGGGDKPPRPCVDVAHFKYLHLSHLQHLWCALPVLPSSTPTICPHSTFPKCFIHHWEQIYAGRENNGRLSFTAPLF